ncbi:MAG: DMT family transporter [Nannocystaceae bacterium]
MLPGIFLALLASVCWAIANILIQRSGQAIGSVRTLLWATVAGAIISGIAGLVLGEVPQVVAPGTWLVLGLAGVSGLLGYAGLFYAFEKAALTVTVPIAASWPLLTAFIAIVFLDEHPSFSQSLAAGVVFLGVMVVAIGSTRPPRARGDESPTPLDQQPERPTPTRRGPILGAIAAAVGFGVMIPTVGHVAPEFGELTTAAMVYVVCIIVGVPLAATARISLAPPPRSVIAAVVAIGLFEACGLASVGLARSFAPMTVVAPLSSLTAALTIVYAWIFLGERQSRLVLVGAALASLGVVLLSM